MTMLFMGYLTMKYNITATLFLMAAATPALAEKNILLIIADDMQAMAEGLSIRRNDLLESDQ